MNARDRIHIDGQPYQGTWWTDDGDILWVALPDEQVLPDLKPWTTVTLQPGSGPARECRFYGYFLPESGHGLWLKFSAAPGRRGGPERVAPGPVQARR